MGHKQPVPPKSLSTETSVHELICSFFVLLNYSLVLIPQYNKEKCNLSEHLFYFVKLEQKRCAPQ